MNDIDERYDTRLLAAYVRGALRETGEPFEKPLDQLTEADCEALLALGNAAGLKTHHFKKKDALPRVNKALGFLKAVQPQSLLDVGSGRGAFLFPFLREFPYVHVTSADILEHRVAVLDAMHRGGLENLTAVQADITRWDAPCGGFDVVTLLEVLEHIPNVQTAVTNAVRLARRYVVVTVPAKPDDNPEHIHLLTKPVLTELFHNAGCVHLQFDGVPNHLFMTAKIERTSP